MLGYEVASGGKGEGGGDAAPAVLSSDETSDKRERVLARLFLPCMASAAFLLFARAAVFSLTAFGSIGVYLLVLFFFLPKPGITGNGGEIQVYSTKQM